MIRAHLLTLALGALLTACAAAEDASAPFGEGLLILGTSVGDKLPAAPSQDHDAAMGASQDFRGGLPPLSPAIGATDRAMPSRERGAGGEGARVERPHVEHDTDNAAAHAAPIIVTAARSHDGNAGNRIEQTLGEFLIEQEFARPVPQETRQGLRQFPQSIVSPDRQAVPLESGLSGADLGSHDRVHEFLTRSRRPAPERDVTRESVIAADFLADKQGRAATVQLSDDQLPPPPPEPAPESPPAAAPLEPADHVPPIPDTVSGGFIDPRYQSTGESSIHTSTCHRCGRTYCHCVYAPFGDALRSAFGRQIHLGSAELLTLYAYDFHPVGTPDRTRLTSRGEYQLEKIVGRLQYTPAPIRIQTTGNDALDAARRLRVLEALTELGIAEPDGLVVTVRTRDGRAAVEMLESSYDLLESIRQRGRTIEGGGSAGFTGSTQFGQ